MNLINTTFGRVHSAARLEKPGSRQGWVHVVVSVAVLLLLGFTLTGCVTSRKYWLAKKDTPPATTLGWSVTIPPAELTLQTLIVYQGPGSWKREARWDEYVVKLTNCGPAPLSISTVELIDILVQPQVPGTDPWKLEKLSYTNWDKYGGVGLSLLAGTGGVGVMGFVAFTGAPFLGGAGGAAFTLAAIPLVAVVDIGAVAVMNHNNKHKVMAEFDRRRLKLPLSIAPGATAEGSFFFPLTPGPQRLMLKGMSGEAPVELGLELKPLAGLHLKPVSQK